MRKSTKLALDRANRFGNVIDMPNRSSPAEKDLPQPNRLKEWREAADLTQDELGEKVGTTGQTIGRYEKGSRALTIGHLLQLAPHVKCRPADLLPDPESVISDEERMLLSLFTQLELADRDAILRAAEGLYRSGQQQEKPRLRRKVG